MISEDNVLRIGTRGSPLALAQTNTVCALLAEAYPDLKTEIVVIKTSGDWNPEDGEVRLSEAQGGKGQFAKEIELALLAGEIDAAVHSMKDMDSNLPDGLVIDHMLPREDPRDALLFSSKNKELADSGQFDRRGFEALPADMVVGTASVRRGAFVLSERPDLKIKPFRGNVQTRIDKLRDENSPSEVGCTFLAMAGMRRLGIADEADVVLEPEVMLPAAGQGAVGVEVRGSDENVLSIFSHISCFKTIVCVKSEREVLRVLDGTCHTSIGAYAELDNGEIWLRVRVVSLDGQHSFKDELRAPVATVQDAIEVGHKLGKKLKAEIPAEILTGILSDGE